MKKLFLILLIIGWAGWAQATMTAYVSPNLATGDNDGSSWANAWRQFANIDWAALQTAAASQPVYLYVKKGSTSETPLILGGSGSSDTNRIFITTDPTDTGNNPIIKMSAAITGSWADEGGGVYSIQPAGLARDGLGAWQDTTTLLVKGESSALSAGQFWIDTATTPYTVYVRTTDSSDPGGHTIELSVAGTGVFLDGSTCIYNNGKNYITISQLKLMHGDFGDASNLRGGGVTMLDGSNITFENNEIANTIGGYYHIQSSGTTILQNNYIHHTWNGKEIGAGGSGRGIVAGMLGTLYIRYNLVDETYVGIGASAGATSYVHHNIITNAHVNSLTACGTVATPNYLFNNTIVHTPSFASGHAVSCQDGADDVSIYMQNNAVTVNNSGGEALYLQRSTYSQITTGNNLYQIIAPATAIGLIVSTWYTTLESWQAALAGHGWTGNEAGTQATDPVFFSSTNFHLKSTSPAINAGANLCATLITATDYDGNPVCLGGLFVGSGTAPEIGAYEYLYRGLNSGGFLSGGHGSF